MIMAKVFATYARIVYFHRQKSLCLCYKSEKSVQKKEIIHAVIEPEDGGKYIYVVYV